MNKQFLFLLILFFIACNAPKNGERVQFNELSGSTKLDKKRVMLEGYVKWNAGDIWSRMGHKELVTLTFCETPNCDGNSEDASFTTYLGSAKNELSIDNGGSSTYTPEDVVIHLSDGSKAKLTDKIRLSGDAVYLDTTKFKLFRLKNVVKYSFNLENVKLDAVK